MRAGPTAPRGQRKPRAQPSDLGGPLTPFALPDPYVKVQLLLNQRKWKKRKTSARKGTATPYYNEAFTFLVPFSQILYKVIRMYNYSLKLSIFS